MSTGKLKLYKNLRNKGRGTPAIEYTHDMGNFQNSSSSSGFLRSNLNQNCTVDYGDGTVTVFPMTANVNLTFVTMAHAYSSPWQAGVDKIVKISFEHPDNVIGLSFYYTGSKVNAPLNLAYYRNLTILQFAGSTAGSPNSARRIDNFPFEVVELPFIQTLVFVQAFSTTGNFDDVIPPVIFNKPLVTFEYRENLGVNWTSNNGDKIYQLAATLTTLRIGNLVNRLLFTSLPNDSVYGFQNLTALLELDCQNAADFGTIPAVINGIPTLVILNLGGCGITGYGTTNALVNLVTLNVTQNTSIPDTMPADLISMVKLKSWTINSCFNTIARMDNFISNLYTFVDANAAKTGASSLPFRGIGTAIASTPQPTGVYQQPAGYVAGSNNGTPASPLEKLWVLVNQYAHTNSRTQYTVSGISVGATTTITLNGAVGINAQIVSVITFTGITGTVGAALNGVSCTVTAVSGSTVTVSVNTTGLAYTSGGNFYRITF